MQNIAGRDRKMAFLSGALRVWSGPDCGAAGPRTHMIGMAEGFAACGWRVDKFILGDYVPRPFRKYGVEWGGRNPGWAERIPADVLRVALNRICALGAFRKVGPDVAFVYERVASFQALGRYFKDRGVPWIVHSDGLYFREACYDRKSIAFSGVAKRIELDMYHRCDLLVTVSNANKESLIAEGISGRKIVVIPNAAGPIGIDERCRTPSRWFKELTIGYIGILAGWQNLDMLLEVIGELRETFPVGLVVAGDGPERFALQKRALKLGLSDRCKFLGWRNQEEMAGILAGIDIGYSGQIQMTDGKMYHSPLKLYEYMAHGKPVLASAYDDARSLISDGVNGFLFDSSNRESLKKALIRMASARNRIGAMGMAAAESVHAGHTWRHRVMELVTQANRVLAEAGHPGI